MHSKLYLLCPTDCLESVINNFYESENYFYTSLGNSVVFSDAVIHQITKLVHQNKITEICFVLSHDNKIINDAIENQDFIAVRGLNTFYKKINSQKEYSQILSQTHYNHYFMVSYYLNGKIKELNLKLQNRIKHSITFSGKIYNRFENTFSTIYSELILIEKHQLN